MNIPFSKVIWGIVIAVAIYLAYDYFFSDKTQDDLITRFNNFVFRSSDENESGRAVETKPDPTDAWTK